MYDSVFEEFAQRWGDPNQTSEKKIKSLEPLTPSGIETKDPLLGLSSVDTSGLEALTTKNQIKSKSGNDALNKKGLADAGSEVLSAAPAVMGLIDNAKGGQFDTSAEGGGVGKAGGAIMQGAAQGAEAGKAIGGIFGKKGEMIGTAVGAIGGGLSSTFAHSKARKEYNKNKTEDNLNKNEIEKEQRKKEYARAEGLSAIDNLKSLRKKQIGLY